MDHAPRCLRVFDLCWLLAWIAASSAWCLSASVRLSATFDEPTYLEAGLQHWRTGRVHAVVAHGTMPLPIDAATLPLYLWERFTGQWLDPASEPTRLLPWARAGVLPFWWLLLLYAGLLARRLGGPWAGRLAVALLASEPTPLAHAGLATTDVCLSACLTALLYHYHIGRDSPSRLRRIGWPAFWLAAALLAKISALVFGPLCLLAVELERYLAHQPDALARDGTIPRLRIGLVDCVRIGLLAMGLVLLYARNDFVPISRHGWAASLPVLNEIGYPVLYQIRHNRESQGSLCEGLGLGPEPYLAYFPLVLSMKLSAGLLLLTAALTLRRARALASAAGLAAAAILLVSLTARIQIGVRLVLPVAVLLVVAVAAGWLRTLSRARWIGKSLLAGSAALAVGWSAITSLWLWPNGLGYLNDLWGGPRCARLYLSDSNFDWGQGLLDLERWQRDNQIRSLNVWYFGHSWAMVDYPHPFRRLSLERLPVDGPGGMRERVRGGWLAVGDAWLYASGNCPAALYLRRLEPAARAGTFTLYDFTGERDSTTGL
jgi:hypothetical protein